jgi:hypothetical protein
MCEKGQVNLERGKAHYPASEPMGDEKAMNGGEGGNKRIE